MSLTSTVLSSNAERSYVSVLSRDDILISLYFSVPFCLENLTHGQLELPFLVTRVFAYGVERTASMKSVGLSGSLTTLLRAKGKHPYT